MGEALTTAMTNFGSVWTTTVSLITDNAVLMIFLASGIIKTCFSVFKRAKRAVR